MKTKPKQATRFGVCIDNRGYAASLEVGKLYRVIPDEESSRHGYLRVIDESGEDYGYSAGRFCLMPVPQLVARALRGGHGRSTPRPHRELHPTLLKARRGWLRDPTTTGRVPASGDSVGTPHPFTPGINLLNQAAPW